MNELLNLSQRSGAAMTMTSREIAELTGSTHDNVLKTVRGLVEKGVVSPNDTPYRHPQNGQTYAQFSLTFRDTMVVVSGYSAELRAKIIDRWQELEQSPVALGLPNFLDPAAAAIAWAEQVQAKQVLQIANQAQAKQLEEAAPKVEFHDAVTAAENCQDFATVAQAFKTGRTRLISLLRKQGILKPNNLPYQRYVEAKYFRVVEGTFNDGNGRPRVYSKTMVTGSGLAFIQRCIAGTGGQLLS